MVSQVIVFCSILVVFLVWYLSRGRIRYWAALLNERGWSSTLHYDRCLKIFQNIYKDVNATAISLKDREELSPKDNMAYIYGEVTFYSFVTILEKTEPQPGEIFYDLGSGGGKAVFIAGLVFDFAKVVGIERLKGLYDLTVKLKEKLLTMPELKTYFPNKNLQIEFINSDFLEVDISEVNVLFINATCFKHTFWDAIIGKLVKLKAGTKVIVSGNYLNVGGYELIYSGQHLMSWGMSSINIYKKI